MKKTNWENGILISKAKVTISNTIYEVEPEEYEGKTPFSAEMMNEMEDNIEKSINGTKILVETSAIITENTNYTVPQKYNVGKNDLYVYCEGMLLVKDENYVEIGADGTESTIIQFKDWDVPTGTKLEFLYK